MKGLARAGQFIAALPWGFYIGANARPDLRRELTLSPSAAGLLLSCAFPASPANPLAFAYGPVWSYVALVPLFASLANSVRAGRTLGACFRQGWTCGTVFSLLTLYWIAFTQGGGPGVVGGTLLLSAYLGVFAGVFASALATLVRSFGSPAWLGAPILWTACEYLMTVGELGFPWLLIGHSQAALPSLIQYAEFTGVYGVSFWIVSVNVTLYLLAAEPIRMNRALVLGGLALLFFVPWIGGIGLARAHKDAGARIIDVAVVQNNIGLEKWRGDGLRRSLDSLELLSREAADDNPQLLVWPETAVPCSVGAGSLCGTRITELVEDLGIPILTGAPGNNDLGKPLNSAYLFRGEHQGPAQSYAKMQLVPFGERTPFRNHVPLFRDIDWTALTGDLGPAEFARGEQRTLFRHDHGLFAVLICFESVFPNFVRRSVRGGAEFLINITNDSWFGASAGPFQHAQLAVLRAVENRIGIARCATSGISMFVDPLGRISHATDIFTATYRVGRVELAGDSTFYTRYGDLFAHATLVLSAGSLILLAWRRYRERASHD